MALRAPLTYYRLKRRRFVASFVQPVMQEYESITVKKELLQSNENYPL